MHYGFWLSLLFLTSCSFFRTNDVILTVGDLSFTEKYFADRLIEKLKNVDGMHIKNRELVSTFSDQLEKELIEEGLFFSWAQSQKIKIDKTDIASYLGSRGTTSTGVPTDFIFEAAPAQNLLENHIRLQIIKNHLLSSLEKDVTVSEEELKEEFKNKSPHLSPAQVHVQQILLAKEEDASSVLNKLLSGSSFDEMAKKFSLSPDGSNGGDVGWVLGSSSPQAHWLCQQPLGLVRKVVTGPGGFYIFKINGSKKATAQSFADVKETLKKSLLEKKRTAAYLQWLESRIKNTPVLSNEKMIRTITSHYQETL